MKLLNPLPKAILKPHPAGHIHQFFGEHPTMYGSFKGHPGIDIATHQGDPVRAAHDGLVVHLADPSNEVGYAVFLFNEERSWLTCYGHLREDLPVGIGQIVHAGDVIGYESNTGSVLRRGEVFPSWNRTSNGKGGVHLHFAFMDNVQLGAIPGHRQFFYQDSKINLSVPSGQGLKGWVDPFFLMQIPMYKLIRRLDDEDIYFIKDAKRYHIGNYETFRFGVEEVLWDDETKVVALSVEDFDAIEKGGELILSKE